MNRRPVVVAAVLCVAAPLVLATAGTAQSPEPVASLVAVASNQAQDTAATVALADQLLVPRLGGLGFGVAAGLVAGAVLAFVTWGEA